MIDLYMAEREGFEPSIEFPLYTLSKRAPSTTRPSLQSGYRGKLQPLRAAWIASIRIAWPFVLQACQTGHASRQYPPEAPYNNDSDPFGNLATYAPSDVRRRGGVQPPEGLPLSRL